MKIRLAHNTIQNSSVAVFQANAVTNTDQARAQVLADLTRKARANNLRVDNAALAYQYNGQLRFYGTPDLTTEPRISRLAFTSIITPCHGNPLD